ncbi:sulfatase [Alkalitalea saponilacus]|uniref:Arylsulfatase A n=1 Tax=Alkalitalea saponilacus TaxID=889453 RepID=A0A1T5HN17_9BACT|nr:sulfatase [Alkalitalea saponilacus]ASB49386.1 sulfatase [Alkalitalea saponilacus]SKC21930.1 Arylsulfatase A [Alkalitalea saponilacus]
MKYRIISGVLGNALLLVVPFNAGAQKKKIEKPNVLFIAIDDLKPEMGAYGNSLIHTPNMDRLASMGTIFLENHCQQAISAPSRVSLLTGKRPDYTKVWDLNTQMREIRPETVTIPQHFKENGYHAAGTGKIFDFRSVSREQDEQSWSEPYLRAGNKYYQNGQRPMLYWYQNPENRKIAQKYIEKANEKGLSGNDAIQYALQYFKPSVEAADVEDNAYNDGAMTLLALETLARLASDKKPFFFAVGYQLPHLPFVAPQKYWDLYNRDEMPLAPFQEKAKNSPEIAYHNSGELRSYSDIPPLVSFSDQPYGIGLPEYKQKELIHGYYASTSYVDAQIGKLLDYLEESGLIENTIIVLWGDHGWHLGDHDLWCKHSNFEQATRSPLIISAPGYQPGKTQSVSEFVDVFPTLCELAGIPVPDKLDGLSLVPVLENPKNEIKEFAVSQYPRGQNIMGYSIRNKRYRLTYWIGDGFRSTQPYNDSLLVAKELYDYKRDPLETENIVHRLRYRRVYRKMSRQITGFFESQLKQ